MMSTEMRLRVVGISLTLSTLYAILIAWDERFAQAIAVGYIAVILTAFALVHLWRKH